MTSKTRANYEEATRLRDQDLSLAQIGDRLGCSKQRIHKLLKSDKEGSRPSTKASTTASTGSVNWLTPRDRRFAQNLLAGKSQRQAALGAAPPGQLTERSADTWAARRLKNDGFRAGFKSFLEENGLGEADLTRVLRESLQATKVVATASENGKITDVVEREDHTARLRAVEIGWKLHGRIGPGSNNEQPVVPMKVVVLSQKDADMFRVFRGDGSLPETFEIAPEGVAEAVIEAEAEAGTVGARAEEVLPDEAGG